MPRINIIYELITVLFVGRTTHQTPSRVLHRRARFRNHSGWAKMLASGILRLANPLAHSSTGWQARYHWYQSIEHCFDHSLPTLDPAVNYRSTSPVRFPRPQAHDEKHLAFLSPSVVADGTRVGRPQH